MTGAVKIQLVENDQTRWVTVNEDQICWIDRGPNESALLHMSNGEVLHVLRPSYLAWENDTILRG